MQEAILLLDSVHVNIDKADREEFTLVRTMLRLMSKDYKKIHLPSRTDHSFIVTYIYAYVKVTDSYIQVCYLISLFHARKWEQTKRKLK
jgi:hypothetical protein